MGGSAQPAVRPPTRATRSAGAVVASRRHDIEHPGARTYVRDEAGGVTMASRTEIAAMRRALELAALGPVRGPNPRVGCVLLDPDGAPLGEGWHAGAGT